MLSETTEEADSVREQSSEEERKSSSVFAFAVSNDARLDMLSVIARSAVWGDRVGFLALVLPGMRGEMIAVPCTEFSICEGLDVMHCSIAAAIADCPCPLYSALLDEACRDLEDRKDCDGVQVSSGSSGKGFDGGDPGFEGGACGSTLAPSSREREKRLPFEKRCTFEQVDTGR